jgi:tRNA (uracil-5-)-methyltransferase TRM9
MSSESVAKVYNEIAKDFSQTRYSVWSGCRIFLDSLPPKSSLADIGCGNGKNMLYRPDIISTGVDLCENFIKICKERNLNVKYGNICEIPLESNSHDNTISIAVVHHLDKREDRIKAISELIRITKHGGRIMMSVWAFEQDKNSKRQFATQDEMVSFKKRNGEIFYRYYHLYKKGELDEEVKDITNYKFSIDDSYEENNNYIVILKKDE